MARGTVYKRRDSVNWYIGYPDGRGGTRYESSGTPDKPKADRLLRQRLRALDEGRAPNPDLHKLGWGTLQSWVLSDYENNNLKSLTSARSRFRLHLFPFFQAMKLMAITTARVREYQTERLYQGASNATINREVALVRRGFTILREHYNGMTIPACPTLRENNVREGFLKPEQFREFVQYLPDHLKGVATFAFWTGWRRGEILGLTWDMVDSERGVIRIPDSKNGEPREVPYKSFDILSDVIEEARRHTTTDSMAMLDTPGGIPWVFHLYGEPLVDFRYSWDKARRAAGFPHLLFHDLRRSAVVNLERAGVPRSVAMSITGHKTEAVYRRYAITDTAAQAEALTKLEAL